MWTLRDRRALLLAASPPPLSPESLGAHEVGAMVAKCEWEPRDLEAKFIFFAMLGLFRKLFAKLTLKPLRC